MPSYFGYGYGWYGPPYYYGYAAPMAVAPAPAVVAPNNEPEQGSSIRVTAGAEAQVYSPSFSNGNGGFTLGATASVEGERWGFTASGSNIAVRSECCVPFDTIQSLTAHLTFAPLIGERGRLRIEGGADAFFAPDLIVVGPTLGLSGVVWLAGPLGLEGSAMVTPWPYRQADLKAGLALGLGPVGLRAGWRLQVLNDQGLVDGVVHQDVFNGPYLGAAVVF